MMHLTAEGRQLAEDQLRWGGVVCERDIAILREEYEEQLAAGLSVPMPTEDMTEWIAAHTIPAPLLP